MASASSAGDHQHYGSEAASSREVFKAKDKKTGTVVALKKILMENEKEGFPITALREISMLQKLHHENVTELIEICSSKGGIKQMMKQLFEGLYFIHNSANILHRDMKTANVLITRGGVLKLADFGMARDGRSYSELGGHIFLVKKVEKIMASTSAAGAGHQHHGHFAASEASSSSGVEPHMHRDPIKAATQTLMKYMEHVEFPFMPDVSKYDKVAKIGQGTFGEVFKAKDKKTGTVVALKKILMENEKEGFPITALREIKMLQKLRHANVTELIEICSSKATPYNRTRSTFYLVLTFCEHDLAGLLCNTSVKFSLGEIKQVMKQLLEGLYFIHKSKILHRDMKAANVLITKTGVLKLADFGLARLGHSLGYVTV